MWVKIPDVVVHSFVPSFMHSFIHFWNRGPFNQKPRLLHSRIVRTTHTMAVELVLLSSCCHCHLLAKYGKVKFLPRH